MFNLKKAFRKWKRVDKFKVGDLVCVLEWTSHKDNSYKTDILQIKAIYKHLVMVDRLNSWLDSFDTKIILSLKKCDLAKLNPEFCAPVLKEWKDRRIEQELNQIEYKEQEHLRDF